MPRRRRSNRGGPRPGAGRPRLSYAEMDNGTRLNHVKNVYRQFRQFDEPYEIIRDAFVRLTRRRIGPKSSNLVAECTTSESRAKTLQKVLDKEPAKFAPKEALAMLLHLRLSQYQYSQIAKLVHGISKNVILPAYDFVRRYKTSCRPEEGIQVTEVKAEVELQNILTHTLDRVYEANMAKIESRSTLKTGHISGYFNLSWGFDSATGQRLYKQAFLAPENRDRSDNSLFAAVINPLEIVLEDGTILWSNPASQSPLLVRTFFLEFAKETTEYVSTFNTLMEETINHLQPLELTLLTGTVIEVKPKLFLTMIDGKCFNIITRTAPCQCPVCRCGRNDFNVLANIESATFMPKNNGLDHGANVQHGWMRVLQHLVNVASNLPVWTARATEPRATEIRNARKAEIQAGFFRLGLIVSLPGHPGQGSTLDGNTSRRALRNYRALAEILGISEELIRRLWIVLVCLNNTKYKLHPKKYQRYAIETYRLYVRLYRFYPMSPSVHKLLLHAVHIQENLKYPLGVLSESSGELWHRIRKQIRRDSTRKCSRKATMEDLLNRCLDQSDPVVSETARQWIAHFREKKLELPEEATKLLNVSDDIHDTSSSDDDDDDGNSGGDTDIESSHCPENSSSDDNDDDKNAPRPSKMRRSARRRSDEEPANLSQYDTQVNEENGVSGVVSELWDEDSHIQDQEMDEEEYFYEYNDGD